MKKLEAGLVVLTDIPSIGGLCAILQRRGTFNHEKMGPESFPGGCQVTVHGKGTDGEDDPENLLLREAREEMGHDFGDVLGNRELRLVNDFVSDEKRVVTFACILPSLILEEVRLNASTGGLVMVSEADVDKIKNLREFDKTLGVKDRDTIAMFPDEIEAVKKAFEAFRTPQAA